MGALKVTEADRWVTKSRVKGEGSRLGTPPPRLHHLKTNFLPGDSLPWEVSSRLGAPGLLLTVCHCHYQTRDPTERAPLSRAWPCPHCATAYKFDDFSLSRHQTQGTNKTRPLPNRVPPRGDSGGGEPVCSPRRAAWPEQAVGPAGRPLPGSHSLPRHRGVPAPPNSRSPPPLPIWGTQLELTQKLRATPGLTVPHCPCHPSPAQPHSQTGLLLCF